MAESDSREVELFGARDLRNALLEATAATPVPSRLSEEKRSKHHCAIRLQRAAKSFRLFDLPTEVRDEIHVYVVSREEEDIDWEGNYLLLRSMCKCRSDTPARQPALTRVCRRLRAEALPLYYSSNVFCVHFLRFDFSHLIAHGESLQRWSVNNIGVTYVFIGEEKGEHGQRLRIRCAGGLRKFFEWYALASFFIDFHYEEHEPFLLIKGAVNFAMDLNGKGLREDRLTSAFKRWVRRLDLECRCESDEFVEHGIGWSCSRRTPAAQSCTCG